MLLRLSSTLILFGAITIAAAVLAPWFTHAEINTVFFVVIGLGLLFTGIFILFRKHHRVSPGPILSIAGLLCSLLLIESASLIYEKLRTESSPALELPKGVLKDPELEFRMEPFYAAHDAWGFRNQQRPVRADIVAIGDSHTWGVNVNREWAWPQVLAEVSGKIVYNMALGSYGPVQYRILNERAAQLSPAIVVIGLYLGNDLYDAYRMAYTRNQHADLRDPARRDIAEDSIAQRAEDLRTHPKRFRPPPETGSRTRDALYSLASFRMFLPPSRRPDGFVMQQQWAARHPDIGAFYDDGKIRTVFTPAYRLLALDPDEPRIQEGLRITKECILQILQTANRQSRRLMVVLLPTKESAFAPLKDKQYNQTYRSLIESEAHFRKKILDFCETHKITTADMLPALTRALIRHQQIYPQNADGHPARKGYRVIGVEILKNLVKQGWI